MFKWNLDRADQQFSLFIRKRDGRCMNPMCSHGYRHEAPVNALECSHYWPRGEYVSRFDPDNCVALCHWCHTGWENTKQGAYKDMMMRWLGVKRYNALRRRVENYKYKNIPDKSLDTYIKECREFLTNEKEM